ncbi:MAG: hypothetical protein AAF799_16825 [Myxococcota bacterium]
MESNRHDRRGRSHRGHLRAVIAVVSLLAVGSGCGQETFEPDPYDLDFDIPRTEPFPERLSAYALYEEPMASLQPAERALPYELSSELFTDYAYKQRLLRVPEGTTMTLTDDGELEFPDGAVLVKTFYYPSDMRDATAPVRVIETRLLVKSAGLWNAATYLWNAEQTDATLLLEGTTTAVSWTDRVGQPRTTDYVVPHEGECVTCHQANESAVFIGPTPRNLNRFVEREGNDVNQLAYFQAEGVLSRVDDGSVATIPNYKDDTESLTERARAYLDINCAHCHSPGRWDRASKRDLDFRYSTPVEQTGLDDRRDRVARQLQDGDMPYLGTTLLHDEGIQLVLEYLDDL